MADQDFNIKVVTTADTSGLQKTSVEMQKIREQQEKLRQDAGAAALFARIPPGGAAPAGLTKENAEISDRIGRSFERMAIHAVGIGAIYAAINAIKETAAEINKITDSLDKQGELLIENSRHLIQQSKFAKDDADVLKIAEDAMKNIAAQHKTVEETQKKELSLAQKIADAVTVGPTLGAKPNQQLLDEERAQALRNESAARQIGIAAVRAAEFEKERVAALSTADAIERLNQKIKEQQDLQSKHYQQGDIQGYVEASEAIKEYEKQLDNATKAHQKEQDAVDKTVSQSSPGVQAVLKNEQAARQALTEGREKDADMFSKSAQQFERGLDPQKKAELDAIRERQKALYPEGANMGPPKTVDEWRKQQQQATDEFYKRQHDARTKYDSEQDPELQKLNAGIVAHGGKPVTKEESQRLNTDMLLQDIITELKNQTAIWR